MRILIYQDYIHNNYILFRALQASFGVENVDFVDAHDIIEGQILLKGKIGALVIPGGEDLFFVEKLNGAGNKLIREFVEAGGVYLGICAGSYYACNRLEWAMSELEEYHIDGPRELNFFPGVAIGPVYEFLEGKDFYKQHSNAVRISSELLMRSQFATVKYGGGPIFIPDEIEDKKYTVLAKYLDLEGQPPAIIKCTVKSGMALLVSPHVEENGSFARRRVYKHKNDNYERSVGIADEIFDNDEARQEIWEHLMNLIDNHIRESGIPNK